jgi:hypothetical protein
MTDMQPGFLRRVDGVRFASAGSTLSARITIAVQNQRTVLFRNSPRKCRPGFWIFKKILARFQVIAVIMSEDSIALLIPKFADTARPFAGIAGDFPKFGGIHYPPKIAK